MLLKMSKLSIAALALISTSSMASTTYTANFGSESNDDANQFSLVENLIDITVSGWSDTGGSSDTLIREASSINKFSSSIGNGWGITNKDSGDSHTADNYGSNDYDMFLLEFSDAVNLSEATYSYISSSVSNTQVSVAAITTNDINGKTWSNVANNYTFESDSAQMQSGYYTDFTTSLTKDTYSNYWLIGALNTVFGGTGTEGNDSFKLSGISFSTDPGTPPPTTTVPEPTSIMMFGLALVGFAASRRKTK